MNVIGFANKYYTLWAAANVEGRCNYVYIQNLSMSLEEAKKKISGEFTVDLSVRGSTSFSRITEEIVVAEDEFSFGLLKGTKIRESVDEWQLTRAMKQEVTPERKGMAFDRLRELGVSIHEYNGEFLTDREFSYRVKKTHIEKLESGHHYKSGEKVNLELKEIERFNFETQYGLTYCVTYESKDEKLFKYIGSSPKDEFKEWTNILTTIKHSYYDGKKETHLLRIKVK